MHCFLANWFLRFAGKQEGCSYLESSIKLTWCPGKDPRENIYMHRCDKAHCPSMVSSWMVGLQAQPVNREQFGCFHLEGLQQPSAQESSDHERAEMTFIEQGLRKTKALVSGLKGCSADSEHWMASPQWALFSTPCLKFPFLKERLGD